MPILKVRQFAVAATLIFLITSARAQNIDFQAIQVQRSKSQTGCMF